MMRARTALPAVSGGLALASVHSTANAPGSAVTDGTVWSPSVVVGTTKRSDSGAPLLPR